MSSEILISLGFISTLLTAVLVLGTGILLVRRMARTHEATVQLSTAYARLVHELSVDAAVSIGGVRSTEDAVNYIRANVDRVAADILAEELGANGYERYLNELYARWRQARVTTSRRKR